MIREPKVKKSFRARKSLIDYAEQQAALNKRDLTSQLEHFIIFHQQQTTVITKPKRK